MTGIDTNKVVTAEYMAVRKRNAVKKFITIYTNETAIIYC